MDKVTIKITDDGKVIEIPFKPDTNLQEALEQAYDQEKAAGNKFSFALQYFGYFGQEYMGYQIIMIDGIYDNPKDPNDYWQIIVNGKPAQVGIDNYMVNAGDVIEFDYTIYIPGPTSSKMLQAKHEFYSQLN